MNTKQLNDVVVKKRKLNTFKRQQCTPRAFPLHMYVPLNLSIFNTAGRLVIMHLHLIHTLIQHNNTTINSADVYYRIAFPIHRTHGVVGIIENKRLNDTDTRVLFSQSLTKIIVQATETGQIKGSLGKLTCHVIIS
jgi:hypothetical protein